MSTIAEIEQRVRKLREITSFNRGAIAVTQAELEGVADNPVKEVILPLLEKWNSNLKGRDELCGFIDTLRADRAEMLREIRQAHFEQWDTRGKCECKYCQEFRTMSREEKSNGNV